jgi:hypothetical protein
VIELFHVNVVLGHSLNSTSFLSLNTMEENIIFRLRGPQNVVHFFRKITDSATLRQIRPGQITQRISLWYILTLQSRLLLFLPNSLLTANKNRRFQAYFTAHKRDDLFCSFFQFSSIKSILYEKLSLPLITNRSTKVYGEWSSSSTHSYSCH